MLLLALALAWLAGSGMAALAIPLWAAPAGAAFAFWWGPRRGWALRLVVFGMLAAVSLGSFRWYERQRPEANANDVSHFIGVGPTRVRGVVEGDRDEREHALMLRLDVSSVEDDRGSHSASGVLLLRLGLALPYDDGDRIEARGKPVQPAIGTGFDYRGYLARQGVFAEMDYPATRLLSRNAGPQWRHLLVRARERLSAGIASVLPEPEASLGAGIALGTRKVIEPRLNAALTSTGTAQIVVASGYNITIVSVFTLAALSWVLGRRWAACLTLLTIGAYVAFVGFSPSVLRAALMGTIVVFAGLAGRPHSGMRALAMAAAIMVAISPLALRDLSFLLSLSGTAGLFVLTAPLSAVVRRCLGVATSGSGAHWWSAGLVESASTTLAAMIASLPVILAAFHTVSLSALPANLILFPLVPAIMAAAAGASVAGAIWHPATLVLAPVAYILLRFMVLVVRLCAELPGTAIRVDWFDVRSALVAFTALAAFVWIAQSQRPSLDRLVDVIRLMVDEVRGSIPRLSAAASLDPEVTARAPRRSSLSATVLALLVGGLALGVLASYGSRTAPAPLRLTYLDVGPGSAVLLEAGGRRILIDGGPPGDATVRALDLRLRPWERSLNLIVVSQRSDGHVGGLPALLARYRVGGVLDATAAATASSTTGAAWAAWQRAIRGSGILVLAPRPAALRVGDATLEVTPARAVPGVTGIPTATVMAERGKRRALIAGDAGASLAADVRGILASAFSVPADPARVEVLEAGTPGRADTELSAVPIALRSALVYRTIENGTVVVEVDERELRVRVDRGPRLGLFGRVH